MTFISPRLRWHDTLDLFYLLVVSRLFFALKKSSKLGLSLIHTNGISLGLTHLTMLWNWFIFKSACGASPRFRLTIILLAPVKLPSWLIRRRSVRILSINKLFVRCFKIPKLRIKVFLIRHFCPVIQLTLFEPPLLLIWEILLCALMNIFHVLIIGFAVEILVLNVALVVLICWDSFLSVVNEADEGERLWLILIFIDK